MSHKRHFSLIEESISGSQTRALYPIIIFCILFSAFIFSTTTPSFAGSSGWAATYGGVEYDRPFSIQQTDDGGYIVAGWTDSFGNERDFWVLKLKSDGTVEWQKTYGGEGWEEARSIQQTSDGGYIVTGSTNTFETDALLVLKLSPNGTIDWQKTYGGDDLERGNCIRQTPDGGYIVAGTTRTFSVGIDDLWVLKLRPDGTVEWERTYGGNDWEVMNSIQQTGDGGYIVAGDTSSFVPRGQEAPDVWILKLNSDGTVEWEKIYGGDDSDEVDSIQQTSDGGYIVAGTTRSFGAGSKNIMDIWVLKLRPDGTVEWQKTYGGVHWDVGSSIQQTSDGGYIVAGEIEFSSPGSDAWILKLKADGSIEWQKRYGGGGQDRAVSIQQTSDRGYIMLGEAESFGAGKGDIWVLKLMPDGSIGPSCNFIDDTNVQGIDSSAAVLNPNIIPNDSDAEPQDSSATVQDTDVSVNILCASTASE